MKVLVFAGSMRKGSLNKKFAGEAARYLKTLDKVEVTYLDLKDFDIPLYNGDLEEEKGIPEGVENLGKLISTCDAMVISTPEYNNSISGVFKNVIDWLSREKPVSLEGKHAFLIAASPSEFGGIRGLWQARIPLEKLGVHVFPDMMWLPHADKAFDGDNRLKDEKTVKHLKSSMDKFIQYGKKFVGKKDK